MAQATPKVQFDTLIYQQHKHDLVIMVGTPVWYAWLATVTTFAFSSDSGTFNSPQRAGGKPAWRMVLEGLPQT